MMTSCPNTGDGQLPLQGIRVLDLTHVWSGPMSTRVLAGLGAQVIKLENPRSPDALRGPGMADLPLRYPDLEPGPDPRNRNAWFNTQNAGKKDVVIDLKKPEGLAYALRLVAMCDLVIANYRPGVMERIGMGYDALRHIAANIVLIEMPGYVSGSPGANAPAFGAQFDAASGNATLTGGEEGPLMTGYALGDPTAGLFAAAAATSALVKTRRTGEGSHIVLPQSEAMIPLLGEYYLAQSVGEPIQEGLNADRRCMPHGVYQTSGGAWLAIAVENDEQWQALARNLQAITPGLATKFATAEQRHANAPEVTEAVRTWAATVTDPAMTARSLQSEGVPSAPLQHAEALSVDPQLAAASYFQSVTHPSCGTHRYPTLPIQIDGRRTVPSTAAPTFAAHTEWCLRELIGLDDDAIDDLAVHGVIGLPNKPSTLPPDTYRTAEHALAKENS